jgi:hypothetical protein
VRALICTSPAALPLCYKNRNAGRGVTIDRERLVRLLRMTESDRDAEALIAIRKSNELLKAHRMSWSDVIELPEPLPAPAVSSDWSHVSLKGYERSDMIRRAIRREFPITLAFFPLWIAAELLAILYPNIYWNKNGKRLVVAFWSLCGLGLLSWFGAGAWLLCAIGS